jgi:plasmid stability protein
MVTVQLNLPDDVLHDLQAIADMHGMSVDDLVRTCVAHVLDAGLLNGEVSHLARRYAAARSRGARSAGPPAHRSAICSSSSRSKVCNCRKYACSARVCNGEPSE